MAKIKDVKIDDIEVTAIGEIPNIVTVSEDYKTEISEEIKNEEVITEIVEEIKVPNKNLDYSGRGFKSLDDAYNFIKTERFANLGDADKAEFMNWLEK